MAKALPEGLLASLTDFCNGGSFYKALYIVDHHFHHTRNRLTHNGCKVLIYALIQASESKKHLRSVSQLISDNGLQGHTYLGSHLIRKFASFGGLHEANDVFRLVSKPNKFTWAAIILANANLGDGKKAIELYHEMLRYPCAKPDSYIFVAVIKACGTCLCLEEGRSIENQIELSERVSNTFVGNALIDMYMKCGSFEDAYRAFDTLCRPDLITWNTVLAGCSHDSRFHEEAFHVFARMMQQGIDPDSATFVSILKSCTKHCFLGHVHGFIIESGLETHVSIGNTLIHMYALNGSLIHACQVFDRMPKSKVVTWNAMMSGQIQRGHYIDTIHLFALMQSKGTIPNQVTFLCTLRACSELGDLDLAGKIHACIIESCVVIEQPIDNSLIDTYSKCGSLGDARWVFEMMPQRTVVSYNAMIYAFVHHGQSKNALEIFYWMHQQDIRPDPTTFVSILTACTSSADTGIRHGLEIHSVIIMSGLECETVVGNALTNLYTRCGALADARRVFDMLKEIDTISWTMMIMGYVQHSSNGVALLLFQQMQLKGVKPDRATFLASLRACTSIAAAGLGDIIYELVVEFGCELDEMLQSTIVHMYIRCGRLTDATHVFGRLFRRDIVTWNALISGYAQSGDRKSVKNFFEEMLSKGIRPDDVTFVGLLSASSHDGVVEEGHQLFASMNLDYGVVPSPDHFNGLVDVLGRGGFLIEAEDLLHSMPSIPNILTWTSLLGHCKTYGNIDVGRQCYRNFVALHKEDAAGYVLMQDIFTAHFPAEVVNQCEGIAEKVQCKECQPIEDG